jgi:hypothetical protein
MGSRIMHYCIASMVNKSLRIQDTAFYLGSLAPDVHAYMGTSQYHATHFSLRSKQGETYTDYGAFISKYPAGLPLFTSVTTFISSRMSIGGRSFITKKSNVCLQKSSKRLFRKTTGISGG